MHNMRLMIVPEIPRDAMALRKERIEGVSHARGCHSQAGDSQQEQKFQPMDF